MPEISNDSILHEMIALQRESNERDARIESKMDSVNTRMEVIEKHSDKQDKQIEKLTEILSDQKQLTITVSTINSTLKSHEQRITDLEQRPAKQALALWQRIGITALTCLVTAVAGIIIGKFI